LELERLVATLVRVGKTDLVGKGVSGRCSRIVTDQLGVFGLDNGERQCGRWQEAEKQIPRHTRDDRFRLNGATSCWPISRCDEWDSILGGKARKIEVFAVGRYPSLSQGLLGLVFSRVCRTNP
jgi:hypothetical protein